MVSSKQKVFDLFNRFLLRLKKSRRIKIDPNVEGNVMVNVGSGMTVAPGWFNIDGSPSTLFAGWPKFYLKFIYKSMGSGDRYSFEKYYDILSNNKYVHHKAEYGIPFDDNSVDFVYSSHLLEHLFKEDAVHLLKHSFRVLKSNGIVRICVPDLEIAFHLFKSGKTEECLSLFFMPSNFNNLYIHRYMYDFQLLKKYLLEIGFKNVIKCQYKQGATPDLDILDVKPEETLYVEAIKP